MRRRLVAGFATITELAGRNVDMIAQGRCGNQEERDKAYHNGTVWPWLIGPFCEGWLKVYGLQGVPRVKKLIWGFEEVMSEHGVSTISEIHDGDPPHAPNGTISQAWSVGEILRIMDLLENKYSL